jgi:4'-phosphopantetheinyl transferase
MIDVSGLEQTQQDVAEGDDWLSAGEVVRLGSMRFPKRRADWRLGRWTAKQALAFYWNMRCQPRVLAGIEIRSAPSGAPEVWLANRQAPVVISLSHREGRAACAVASPGADLGCDLEVVEPRSDGFLTDYFATEEQVRLATAPTCDRTRLAALLWSAKESALKAMCVGLRFDTRRVIVSQVEDGNDGAWHPFRVRYDGGPIFAGWWQQTGCFVRTLAAAPSPKPPIWMF